MQVPMHETYIAWFFSFGNSFTNTPVEKIDLNSHNIVPVNPHNQNAPRNNQISAGKAE